MMITFGHLWNLPEPYVNFQYIDFEGQNFVFLDSEVNKVADAFKFDFIDANTVKVYAYKTSTTYTLTRS